ncbi:hypothetical protein RclHR1_11690012 [Rhizophagus clarus]|uniref:Uncharacterized protein n=1 Tax=Rhizophagus clarus TaxID=94130 RepID=A0A2Z6Q6B3_9GLOM|nr:hypothetical protein RclHR1_11690012 [Rhizophagus clarus]
MIINYLFSASASSTMRQERKCSPEYKGLGLQQLCQEQSISSSSTLETKFTNQTSFNFNEKLERQPTLQKLSRDLEAQYSQDVPLLLNILKSFYPFNETNGDVLEDDEINDFSKLYVISNVRPILTSDDNYVFWLEDTADNIYYIAEFTHEMVPKNEVERRAKDLANSFESVELVLTRESLNSLRRNEQKKGKKGKKKRRKKKNKH